METRFVLHLFLAILTRLRWAWPSAKNNNQQQSSTFRLPPFPFHLSFLLPEIIMFQHLRFLVGLSLVAFVPSIAFALSPEEIFIVTNKNEPESRKLADHYCKQRKVPLKNIIELKLPTSESISRADFNAKLRGPLRKILEGRKEKAKCLLTMYGVPLRVGPTRPSEEDRKQLKRVAKEREDLFARQRKLNDQIESLGKKQQRTKDEDDKLKRLQTTRKQMSGQFRNLNFRRKWLSHQESTASVDSELMLLWSDNAELRRWQVNVRNWRIPEGAIKNASTILMVSRLDGPSPKIVRGMIDDAIAVEQVGLKGKVYVDARGIKYRGSRDAYGYGGYDQSLRDMAKLFDEKAKLPVVLDDEPKLFAPGSCAEAALYCGWYSHARFVDCCQFAKGAVAYHIASSEAVSLRNPKARYWCPNLLKKGVVATIGPVAEPYTLGFPKPAEFFGFLATGKYTLVECYTKTVLLNSWMTVLVGDPLYNPFQKTPLVREADVQPSPADSEFLVRKKES